MGLGIVKTSWTTVILPPYSSSIVSVLRKLGSISDDEFESLDLYPDFDEYIFS